MDATPPISRPRGGLPRTRRALAEGRLRVGFIGGSITAPTGSNWPEYVIAGLHAGWPSCRILVENAGIGATGSDLACFRADDDLIARGCDLVFVEYAVNDAGVEADRARRTQEGLLRQLLADGTRDVVLVHTWCQEMYPAMMRGELPPSVARLEELAGHYRLDSVWMALQALREVQAGWMRWEEWLPDGLHPKERGSLVYGQAVVRHLEAALAATAPAVRGPLPPALHARCWQHTARLPLDAIATVGPWSVRRSSFPHPWAGEVLQTAAPGAQAAIRFNGRGLVLGFDFGKTSGELRLRLDGGAWSDVQRDRPWWVGDSGWWRLHVVGDELAAGAHLCELEVVHGGRENCTGTTCRLALAGTIADAAGA